MIKIKFVIHKKVQVLKNYTYNDITNISSNTSIICFDNEFDFNNPLFNKFKNNEFNKLIIISNQTKMINNKRLYISNSIKKSFLRNIKNNLLIIINPNVDYENAKFIIKNLIHLKTITQKLHINLNSTFNNELILGIILEGNKTFENDFTVALNALNSLTLRECYIKIYDSVCEFLDNEFSRNNYCEFKDNKCFANRNKTSAQPTMGCCYSFKYSQNPFAKDLLTDVKQCQYLNCATCSIKSISCKLFTCNSLQKKGIKFNTHKILLLDCFFNNKQHLILSKSIFKTKEQIINKLLEKNYEPYFLYYLIGKYRI